MLPDCGWRDNPQRKAYVFNKNGYEWTAVSNLMTRNIYITSQTTPHHNTTPGNTTITWNLANRQSKTDNNVRKNNIVLDTDDLIRVHIETN